MALNASLSDQGVYAGTLPIGGLIERGDIHHHVTSHPERFGDVGPTTLDPDHIADTAWHMYVERDRPEEIFNAFQPAH